METLTLKLPTMYGDHHVIKVRQIVGALPGVAEVVASAAQQQLVVTFDSAQTSAEAITSALTENGYAPARPPAPPEAPRYVAKAERPEPAHEPEYSPPPELVADGR